MLAHSIEPNVDICCSLQLAMTRLDGSQFWGARRRLADVDRAMLSLLVAKTERTPDHDIMRSRGANAPAAPLETLPGKLAGKLLDRELQERRAWRDTPAEHLPAAGLVRGTGRGPRSSSPTTPASTYGADGRCDARGRTPWRQSS